jgi:PEP-CTERM motif
MGRTILGWTQARRVLASVAAGFLLLLVSVASASAQTQISFGNSSQNVSFQSTNGSSLNVGLGCTGNGFTGTPCILSGVIPASDASFGADAGSYYFTTMEATSITASRSSLSQTVFPMSMNGDTSTFVYSGRDGDKLTGNVTWTTVANGSRNPHFNGTLSSIIATGDGAFTNAFSGSSAVFDLILNQLQCNNAPASGCTLESLFADSTSVGLDPVSGGQMTSTPEPASILLFGSGLFVCVAFFRRRRSVQMSASA